MDTTDIDPNAPAGSERCSAHLFFPDTRLLGDSQLQSGAPLRIAETEWPTDILFDAVYASAVTYHFATEELRDVFEDWKDMFYLDGIKTSAQAELDVTNADKAAREKRRRTRALERERRYERRCGHTLDNTIHAVSPARGDGQFRESQEEN